MSTRWAATAALLAVAWGASGCSARGAAQPPQAAEGAGALVEELVVPGVIPGPAWWRVSDADSQVYILIAPAVSPEGMAWDHGALERRMAGANLFILPYDLAIADLRSVPGMAGIMAQAPKLLLAPRPKKIRTKGPRAPLEELLPPDVRARFVAAREALGQPAARYAAMTPWEAGRAIERDYRAGQHLTRGEDLLGGPLVHEMEQLARRDKVRVTAAWRIVIPAVTLNVTKVDEPPAETAYACLDASLTRMVARAQAERAAALAWAQGDVRPLLAPQRFVRAPGCQGASMEVEANGPGIQKAEEGFVTEQVATVERALKMPGRSVAVLAPLSPIGSAELGLLGRRGVLERLRAKGYAIAAPDVLTE